MTVEEVVRQFELRLAGRVTVIEWPHRVTLERAKRAAPCCEHCVELYEDLAPKLAHVTINDGRQFSFLRNSYGFLECMVLSDDEREPYIGDTDEDTLEWAIGRVVM